MEVLIRQPRFSHPAFIKFGEDGRSVSLLNILGIVVAGHVSGFALCQPGNPAINICLLHLLDFLRRMYVTAVIVALESHAGSITPMNPRVNHGIMPRMKAK